MAENKLVLCVCGAGINTSLNAKNQITSYLEDRLNPDVAAYYQTYHPAMFRLIGHVAEAFRREGKDVSVCGELGGDMLAVPVLLGLGIQKISMGMAVLGEVKKLISGLEMSECKSRESRS